MKQEAQEKGVRKSARQRVPNSFYTQGINQLKRAQKMPEVAPKNRKKSKIYDEEDASMIDERMELSSKNQNQKNSDLKWYSCKLPNKNSTIKVQFVLNDVQEPEKKKEEPAKAAKKSESQFDLLSLFQKAIQNVNEEQHKIKIETQDEPVKVKQVTYAPKRKIVEDIDGKIIEAKLQNDILMLKHSKFGNYQIPMINTSIQEEMLDQSDQIAIKEYQSKFNESKLIGSISILG